MFACESGVGVGVHRRIVVNISVIYSIIAVGCEFRDACKSAILSYFGVKLFLYLVTIVLFAPLPVTQPSFSSQPSKPPTLLCS